jgi:excisionase family DNA binding protein
MTQNPNPAQINPRMLTIPLIAKYLSATNWFVEELIRKKQLPARKFGKSWVVDLHDINRWIEDEKEENSIYSAVRILTDAEAQEFFKGIENPDSMTPQEWEDMTGGSDN